MLFKLHDSKNGIIESISIDVENIDKDVAPVIAVSAKSISKIKIIDGHIIIIKTEKTFEELMKLNKDFSELVSDFIIERLCKKEEPAF